MKLEEASVLLPCHSLEDFPTHYTGDEARGLLAAWSALWHPALLAHCGKLPAWHRADDPCDAAAGKLFVVPPTSELMLRDDWLAEADRAGAKVIRGQLDRTVIAAEALAFAGIAADDLDAELVGDFLALGWAYLTIEVLTRQMRYMSEIDEAELAEHALVAARACIAQNAEETRAALTRAFELLIEARERFYPVDVHLIDLTLLAPTTVGRALAEQLAGNVRHNVLLNGETLSHMADTAHDTLAALRDAVERKNVSLIGGTLCDDELPLMPIESVLENFRSGSRVFRDRLGQPPAIYGRRRAGLSPLLPLILTRSGFKAALHFTLDDGRFPTTSQSKTCWEGLAHASIDALTRIPLDANAAESFLALPRILGDSMDHDYVAVVMFAHWPSQISEFYSDLWRMARYGDVFGKFVTLDEFFTETASPGDLMKFNHDGYPTPYLFQFVARGEARPISRFIDAHQRAAAQMSIAGLRSMAAILGQRAADQLDNDDSLAARQLADVIAGRDATETGMLLFNAHSFARRALVDVTELGALPVVETPVLAVQESAGRRLVLADLPGMGFCWISGATSAPAKKSKASDAIAGENRLANEHLQVDIHAETGGIRAIYALGRRGNRLSAQLAMRFPPATAMPHHHSRDDVLENEYSTMSADRVEITHNGPACGEIVSHGKLLAPDGARLASFVQRYRLARGARVLTIDTTLDIERLPDGNPWQSYYALRCAWADETADLYRDVALTMQPTNADRIEAPNVIEIRDAGARTALLTGGVPWHLRSGTRMIDSLFVVAGEDRRHFTCGIGVDLAHPMHDALSLFDPVIVVGGARRPSASAWGWLFHLDAPNVIATHWSAIDEGGRTVGYRVRLRETEGLAVRTRLRSVREVNQALQVDFQGEHMSQLPVGDNCVTIEIGAFDWIEVEAYFTPL